MLAAVVIDHGARASRSPALRSNMVRGVTYHSRKSTAAPPVNRVVVSGTFTKTCGKIPPDTRMKVDGRPAERRFASDTTNPHANAASGANISPTHAMPPVANSEAFKLPRREAFGITTGN